MLTQLQSALLHIETSLQALGDPAWTARVVRLRELLNDSRLHVAIFGEFNRGKSTLINALLGRVVLPTKLIPTTGQVTRLIFGSPEVCRVRRSDGRVETYSLDHLDTFVLLDPAGRSAGDLDGIEVTLTHPLLRQGVVLIDTPGVNEQQAQTQRTLRAVEQADLVLLVVDARQVLTSYERALGTGWLSRELGKPVAVVLNFVNLIEECDRPAVRARVDHWCRAHVRPLLGRSWFEVNALPALATAIRGAPPQDDDFPPLRDVLVACTNGMRSRLQRISRAGQVERLVGELSQDNVATIMALNTGANRLIHERHRRRHELQTRRRRFEANAQIAREQICNLTAETLNTHLAALVGRAEGSEEATVTADGSAWYTDQVLAAISDIEDGADAALRELAGADLPRPAPLALRERLSLQVRLEKELLSPSWRLAPQLVGAGIGLVVGGVAMPGVGAFIGTVVGRAIGGWLGSQAIAPVQAYVAAVRRQWEIHTQALVALVSSECDARVESLRAFLDEQQAGIDALPTIPAALSSELRQREELQTAIERCQLILRAW